MSTSRRIIIALIILIVVTGSILVIQSLRRGGYLYRTLRAGQKEFSDGCVPVSSGGKLLARFCRKDAGGLKKTSFREKNENKLQEGWLLHDVILRFVKEEEMFPETMVRVASSSRGKKADILWKDISIERNMIMLAVTRQGNLKLVSAMKGLDTREQWVQDVETIEVVRK